MAGFRVVLADANAVEVREATDYAVTDDGTLVLRADGTELLRVAASGWVRVAALGLHPPPDVAALLDQLCVDLGLCLPPEQRVRLHDSPPGDVDAFTDAVLRAEGLDPLVVDKRLRTAVRARVAQHVAGRRR